MDEMIENLIYASKPYHPVQSHAPIQSTSRDRDLGNQAFSKGQYELAIFFYNRALEIESKNASLYTNRSLAEIRLNRPEEALKDALMALSIDPNHIKALHRAGRAESMLHRPFFALYYFRKASQLEPENVPVQKDLLKTSLQMINQEDKLQLQNLYQTNNQMQRDWILWQEPISWAQCRSPFNVNLKSCKDSESLCASLLTRGFQLLKNEPEEAAYTFTKVIHLLQDTDLTKKNQNELLEAWDGRAQAWIQLKRWVSGLRDAEMLLAFASDPKKVLFYKCNCLAHIRSSQHQIEYKWNMKALINIYTQCQQKIPKAVLALREEFCTDY